MDPGAGGAGVDDEAEAVGAGGVEAGGGVGAAGDSKEVIEEGEREEASGQEPAPLAAGGGSRPEGWHSASGGKLGPVGRDAGGRR